MRNGQQHLLFGVLVVVVEITTLTMAQQHTAEKLDTARFRKYKRPDQYGFTLLNGVRVSQFLIADGYYEERTPPTPNAFITYREYYPDGSLKLRGDIYRKDSFQKGIWRYYDAKGRLTKTTDFDKPYTYIWAQLSAWLKHEKITYAKIQNINRKQLFEGKYVWYVLWEKKAGGTGEQLTIDGIIGKVLERKQVNIGKEI
jgi:hypothetical protein